MTSPYSETFENDGGVIEIVIPVRLAEHLALGEINLSNFCRICFNESSNMTSMFEDSKPSIASIFTLFTSIQISYNDNSPPNVCQTCREQILNCYEFKQQCEKSDIIWKSTINNQFITQIKEEPNVKIDNNFKNEEPFPDSLQNEEDETLKEENDDTHYSDDCNEENQIQEFEQEVNERRIEVEIPPINAVEFPQDNNQINKEMVDLSYECGHCSKAYPKLKSLKQHIRMVHSVKSSTFPCKFCKQTFRLREDLHIHSSVHEGKGLTCNQCAKVFVAKNRLRRHLLRHMLDKKYKCDSCDKDFSEQSALYRHNRTHTGEVIEKKYACEMCEKRYATGYALRVHSVTHTGNKAYVCAVCAQTFASAPLLRSHMRVHDDNKPYRCYYCNNTYRYESVLNTHLRTHTGERPYVCAVCGKTFIQHSNLSLHMKVHSDKKSYECKICSRSFKVVSTLKAHMVTHTGEKPYECKICRKRFSRKSMGLHMKRHSGERPHACSVCPKRFLYATALRDHNRLHTGEKPFECNTCNQKFHTKTHLRTHIKSHIVKKKRRKTYQKKANNKTKEDELNIAVESLGFSKFLDSEVPIDCIGELELQNVDDNSRTEYIVLEPDQNAVKVTTFNHNNDICL